MRLSEISASLLLVTSVASAASDRGPLRVGEQASTFAESVHPYPGGDPSGPIVVSKQIKHPGATYMGLHFSSFELAPGDEVTIRDPDSRRTMQYTGRGWRDAGEFWTMRVPGDTAVVEIRAHNPGGGYGFVIDGYEHGFIDIYNMGGTQEALCGSDDKRDVECHVGSHPTEYDRSRSVARMIVGGGLCTGWLVSCDNHLFTNEHCKPAGGPSAAEAQFNYQNTSCGGGGATPDSYQGNADIATDAVLDYWLLTIQGDPVSIYGYLRLDPRPIVAQEEIYIPQHPGGSPKMFGIESDLDAGNVCRINRTNRPGNGPDTDTGYFCDTAGGSSGSPVLARSSHQVIALHHFGTGAAPGACDFDTDNGAVRFENIYPQVENDLPACSICNPLPTPVNTVLQDTNPNELTLAWDPVAGATGYEIRRAEGGCLGGIFQDIATVTGTTFVDTTVSVGIVYAYIVRARDDTGCASQFATCDQLVASGNCTLEPTFAGASSVASGLSDTCQIDVTWGVGAGRCSSNVVYNVYRSGTPGFTPGPATLVQSCLPVPNWSDTTAQPVSRYFYIVRGEDTGAVGSGPCAGGVEDSNLVEHSGRATALNPLVDWLDDVEASPQLTLETPWAVSSTMASSGAMSYEGPSSFDGQCVSLTTPPVVVSATSQLRFESFRNDIEDTWDGGIVQVSADNGTTWSRLALTPDYPGIFDNRSSACSYDGTPGGFTGADTAWTTHAADLSPWVGREIMVRFLMGTDGSVLQGSWFVDDVAITNAAESPCTGGCAGPLGRIWDLFATKSPTVADVRFEWSQDPAAVDGYGVYRVDTKEALQTDVPLATPNVCGPIVPQSAAPTCGDPAAMPPGVGYFYNVRSRCGGNIAPE